MCFFRAETAEKGSRHTEAFQAGGGWEEGVQPEKEEICHRYKPGKHLEKIMNL